MSYFLNGNFKDNEFELITRDKYFRDETQIIERRYQRSVCITRSHKFEKNDKHHNACLFLFKKC